MAFWQEFKAFAVKGNVFDLAIAVIIGTAFGKIVSSLVDNIIMPVIGIFLGGINFSGLTFGLGSVVLKYGTFIQSIVDFFIISLIIFLTIRGIAKVKRREPEIVVEATPSEEVLLLREIRDSLRRD